MVAALAWAFRGCLWWHLQSSFIQTRCFRPPFAVGMGRGTRRIMGGRGMGEERGSVIVACGAMGVSGMAWSSSVTLRVSVSDAILRECTW